MIIFWKVLMAWCLGIACLYGLGAFSTVWWAAGLAIGIPVAVIVVIVGFVRWGFRKLERRG